MGTQAMLKTFHADFPLVQNAESPLHAPDKGRCAGSRVKSVPGEVHES